MSEKLDRRNFIVGVNNAGKVIENRIPPATEQEVEEFEAKIGTTLPPDYRQFLKTTNGGQFNPLIEKYICFDVGRPYFGSATTSSASQPLNYLFTLSAVTLNQAGIPDVLHLNVSYRDFLNAEFDYPNRPVEFVPIGDTPGSNLIIIGIRGDHAGKVASYEYMEHDLDHPLEDVFHIANSFDDFLDGLYFYRPD